LQIEGNLDWNDLSVSEERYLNMEYLMDELVEFFEKNREIWDLTDQDFARILVLARVSVSSPPKRQKPHVHRVKHLVYLRMLIDYLVCFLQFASLQLSVATLKSAHNTWNEESASIFKIQKKVGGGRSRARVTS